MNEVVRDSGGRWLSNRNPAGRPMGSRHRLAEQFIRDAYELWKAEGPAALVQMRKGDNTKFCQMMAGLIPRDLVLSVEENTSPFAALDPAEKRRLAEMLYRQLEMESAKVIDVKPGNGAC